MGVSRSQLHIFVLVVTFAWIDACCRFAPLYSAEDLLNDPKSRESFIHDVMVMESNFHSNGVGISEKLGLTYDGRYLNATTGDILHTNDALHTFSAASKESLHINMLTLAIHGNLHAKTFISPNDPATATERALAILTAKIKSYKEFNENFPGYGGFLPWFAVYDDTISAKQDDTQYPMQPTWDWKNRVPALDNGQLIWAIYGLFNVLRDKGHDILADEWESWWQLMRTNIIQMFYEGDGKIRSVTIIQDMYRPPSDNNYISDCADVNNPSLNCFLDDPYEGELVAYFMDLYAEWKHPAERDLIWYQKRAKLQSVDYFDPIVGNITVQKGWWFSSHEQWKLMILPFDSVAITKRVFANCEKARTLYSLTNGIPGLYASVNDFVTNGYITPDYAGATGIQSIAFQQVYRTDIITPYGSFPVMLANETVGLVWYNNMLKGPKMQGPFGSTESVAINGTAICPLVTWDSKITTVLAILGGVKEINKQYMQCDGTYQRFHDIAHLEYSRVFTQLQGEDIKFSLPNVNIPTIYLEDFTECSC